MKSIHFFITVRFDMPISTQSLLSSVAMALETLALVTPRYSATSIERTMP